WDIIAGTRTTTFADLAFLGPNPDRAFVGLPNGRAAYVDNRHGSVVVLDPAAPATTDLQIDPAPLLPDGVTSQPYPGFTLTATGASGAGQAWEVTSGGDGSGNPAPGLVLDPATGAISGTPTQAGAWTFMVRLKDGPLTGFPRYDLQPFQVRVLGLQLVTLS